jgi:hypothetical protein
MCNRFTPISLTLSLGADGPCRSPPQQWSPGCLARADWACQRHGPVAGDAARCAMIFTADRRRSTSSMRPGKTTAGHGLPFEQPERLGEVVVSFLREIA